MDADPRSVRRESRPATSGGYTIVPVDDGIEDELAEFEIVPPGAGARAAAAVSYLGALCLVVVSARPRWRFVKLHSRVAVALHLARMLSVATALLLWWQVEAPSSANYGLRTFSADVGLLLLAGVPSLDTLGVTSLQPWIIWPLGITWLLSLIGFYLSVVGKTADFGEFVNADWNDIVRREGYERRRAARERQQARAARLRHVERLQRTTRSMGMERVRQERSREVEEQIDQLQAEREHLTQLLSLGEISRRRYDAMIIDIDEEIAALRAEKSAISLRADTPRSGHGQANQRVNRPDRTPASEVDTITIVSPSGVPLFTYGDFQLDDALVAGILSVFDSISEEAFGSRVHKTELAEGQVLHFTHGQYVVLLVVFSEEPAPRQIQQLREMLRDFEAANDGPLARQDYDPQRLHEVNIPFQFRQRV